MKGIREAQQDLAGIVSEKYTGNLHQQRWDSCATFTAITDEKALTGGITLSLGAYTNLKNGHQMVKTHCFVQLGSRHSLLEKLCFWRLLSEHGEKIDCSLFTFQGSTGLHFDHLYLS